MGIAVLILLGAAIGWAMSIGFAVDRTEGIGLYAGAAAAGALVFPILSHVAFGTSNVFAGIVGLGALAAATIGSVLAVFALRFAKNRTLA